MATPMELVRARVVRHDGPAVLVARPDATVHVHLRATTPPVAVGDWVLVDDDVVHEVEPRASLLRRRDPTTGVEQLIAANVDVVGIVCGLDRPIKAGRIERFVTQTWDAGARPLVVLTKRDVLDEPGHPEGDAAIEAAVDAAPGTDLVVVSAVEDSGMDELRAAVAGHTVAFVGESGAGKSTLVNALAGRDIVATQAVRHGDHKGRHTTTARELHELPDGCSLIDTPGLRAVGLWTDTETVDAVFDDIAALAPDCRFRDCRHDREPGCAVRAAVDEGTLPADRVVQWERLRKEAAAAELRADPHAMRQAGRRFAKMVKEVQNRPS